MRVRSLSVQARVASSHWHTLQPPNHPMHEGRVFKCFLNRPCQVYLRGSLSSSRALRGVRRASFELRWVGLLKKKADLRHRLKGPRGKGPWLGEKAIFLNRWVFSVGISSLQAGATESLFVLSRLALLRGPPKAP